MIAVGDVIVGDVIVVDLGLGELRIDRNATFKEWSTVTDLKALNNGCSLGTSTITSMANYCTCGKPCGVGWAFIPQQLQL